MCIYDERLFDSRLFVCVRETSHLMAIAVDGCIGGAVMLYVMCLLGRPHIANQPASVALSADCRL